MRITWGCAVVQAFSVNKTRRQDKGGRHFARQSKQSRNSRRETVIKNNYDHPTSLRKQNEFVWQFVNAFYVLEEMKKNKRLCIDSSRKSYLANKLFMSAQRKHQIKQKIKMYHTYIKALKANFIPIVLLRPKFMRSQKKRRKMMKRTFKATTALQKPLFYANLIKRKILGYPHL